MLLPIIEKSQPFLSEADWRTIFSQNSSNLSDLLTLHHLPLVGGYHCVGLACDRSAHHLKIELRESARVPVFSEHSRVTHAGLTMHVVYLQNMLSERLV